MKKLFLLLALMCLMFFSAHATIIYVNPNAPQGGDGTTWATAFSDLNIAVSNTDSEVVDSLFLATGTFYITGTLQFLYNNVVIKGGYDAVSNIQNGYTIIDGADTYQIFHLYALDSTSSMDHLILQNGNSNSGGAMSVLLSSFTISDVVFKDNFAFNNAGALYNYQTDDMTYKDVSFLNNHANGLGGAIYNQEAEVNLVGAFFNGNVANYGGGIYNHQSSSNIYNSVIVNNSANSSGGVIFNSWISQLRIENSTVYNNQAGSNGAVINNAHELDITIKNSVFYANAASSTEIISGPGTINSQSSNNAADDISGLFGSSLNLVDLSGSSEYLVFENSNNILGDDDIISDDDGLFPAFGSPLINAGLNNTVLVEDIVGNNRIADGLVDIGAYEYQGVVSSNEFDVDDIELCDVWTDNNGLVYLKNNASEIGSVTVYSSLGHLIFNTQICAGETIQLTSCLNSGLYVIEFLVNKNREINKVVVNY